MRPAIWLPDVTRISPLAIEMATAKISLVPSSVLFAWSITAAPATLEFSANSVPLSARARTVTSRPRTVALSSVTIPCVS